HARTCGAWFSHCPKSRAAAGDTSSMNAMMMPSMFASPSTNRAAALIGGSPDWRYGTVAEFCLRGIAADKPVLHQSVDGLTVITVRIRGSFSCALGCATKV